MTVDNVSNGHGPVESLSKIKAAGKDGVHAAGNAKTEIIDIRRAAVEFNIKQDIVSQWSSKTGPRTLPTLLLYDERGLQLFEEVSLCPITPWTLK